MGQAKKLLNRAGPQVVFPLWRLNPPSQGSLGVLSVTVLGLLITSTCNSHTHALAGQGVLTILGGYLLLQFSFVPPFLEGESLLEVAEVTFQFPAPRGASPPLLRKQL